MSQLTLRVRNFLGVTKADVVLNGIVLIGGHNGSGKSSLLEAASCAALQAPHVRGLTSNKAAAAVLKEGTQAGSVTLEYDGGAVRVVYPGCELDQTGRPASLGSALGLGSERYMALKPADRVKEITERFSAAPTMVDFGAWIATKPDHKISDDAIASLWGRIEVSGWDAIHKQATEHGTKLKGRWEQITGRRWGSAIAKTWMPAPLLEGEIYDLAAEEAALVEAKAVLEDKLRNAAFGQARKQQLEHQAGELPILQQRLRELADEAGSLSEQAERLIAERGPHADIGEGPNYLRCPGCGASLRHVQDRKGAKLEAVTKHATPTEVRDALKALERIDGARKAVSEKLSGNAGLQASLGGQLITAEKARDELAKAEGAGSVTEDEIGVDRDRSLLLDRKVTAIKAMNEAWKVAQAWQDHTVVVEALEPDGVRATVLSRRLSEINAKLGEIASLAKFDAVALEPDFTASYDGRRYLLLSESEKWRVDLSLALLFGQQEKAPFVLVDRLDVLHPGARPGVLMALKHLGIPSLIACTAKERSALPDLEKAKIGSLRWLTAGVLEDAKS